MNTDDNLGSPDDHDILCDWEAEVKEKKLGNIRDKLGKNLVSLLLNKDPLKRPDAKHVLCHPFLTGQRVSRLQGDQAIWDIFLSYRVASDSDHVEAVYKSLTDKGLKVWWDKKCLLPGQNWEEGFCSGLMSSANFVCLLSRGAICNPNSDRSNFEKLSLNSDSDNVLLEWRLALELKERGMIEGIFPILIGDKGNDGKYSNYFRSGCQPNKAPDTHVESVERKLRDHLDREGLGLPLKDTDTVRSILGTIVANQGGFLEGEFSNAVANISNTIEVMVNLDKDRRISHRSSEKQMSSTHSNIQHSFSPNSQTASQSNTHSVTAPSLGSTSNPLSSNIAQGAGQERLRQENVLLRQQLDEEREIVSLLRQQHEQESEELFQEIANITTKRDETINALMKLLLDQGIVLDSAFRDAYGIGAIGGGVGVYEANTSAVNMNGTINTF